MKDAKAGARKAAVYLLDQIFGERRLMSELLGGGVLDHLDPADRARAQRLANETLRGLERADRLLQKHLRKNPPLTVRNVLRLGVVELCSGGDAHGIVNEAVTITASNRRTVPMKGLVNAVLRKIAADGVEEWQKLRAPRLPKWLRGPLVQAYDGETVAAFEQAHLAGAPLDLTAKTNPENVADATGGVVTPTGSVRVERAGKISDLPGFSDGHWWVQDAAAALPVRILAPRAGEKILDLCAAPGGKTMQLAASGADVTAVDDSPSRMLRVRENLSRVGLRAELTVADALEYTGGPYDAVLLDAPCSATGTIRRHPDLPFAKDGSDFGMLIELQERLLDHAVGLLKPGGRLVFCTCSLLPDEGECQIEDVLGRNPELKVARDALNLSGIDPAWMTKEGGLRTLPSFWPNSGGMDGFYMACLRK